MGAGTREFKDLVVGIMESRNEGRLAAEGLAGVKEGKEKAGKKGGAGKVEQGEGKAEDAGVDDMAELESATP